MKIHYQVLKLRPYPGVIYLFRDLLSMRSKYEDMTKQSYTFTTEVGGGQFIRVEGKPASETVYLVYAKGPAGLAHEYAHVLLHIFEQIKSHPADGNGEPFCYMLSQLILESK